MNAPPKPNIRTPTPTPRPDDQTLHSGRCDNAPNSHSAILTRSPKRIAQHVARSLIPRYVIRASVYFGGQQKPLCLTRRSRPLWMPGATSAGLAWPIKDHLYPVIEMKRSGPMSSLGSGFDNFLLAPIGEDNNGMVLSVLSALARLDVDPWEEAATLARLAGSTATRKLDSLIAALPDGLSARPNSGTIAARLISLLPRRVGSDVRSTVMLPVTKSPFVRYFIVYVIFTFFMLACQWLLGSPQTPAQVNSATTLSTTSSVSPQALPPSTGQ
jgi:hypothetical protein